MPLSAQEKAAIITVAGNWALKSADEASPIELTNALKAAGSIQDVYIPYFVHHYGSLVKALGGK